MSMLCRECGEKLTVTVIPPDRRWLRVPFAIAAFAALVALVYGTWVYAGKDKSVWNLLGSAFVVLMTSLLGLSALISVFTFLGEVFKTLYYEHIYRKPIGEILNDIGLDTASQDHNDAVRATRKLAEQNPGRVLISCNKCRTRHIA